MNFQSFGFLAFFLLSLGVTLLAARRSQRLAEWCMLLFSLAAYVVLEPKAAVLLVISTCITFCAVRFFEWAPRRRRLYRLAVGWHVLVLVWFKYMNFILTTAEQETVTHSFIPVGISFFTFQQIWYLKECYEGRFRRVEPRQFLLASVFYPTISSGPILRPADLSQFGSAFHPSWADLSAGLYALAIGFGKKVLLADHLAEFVNKGWQFLPDLTVAEAWCVILGYTLQLYFDFSGYCDIASGFARCMGIRLPMNFDSPYRALSVTRFWKGWHMTLTTFLRECIYFPLGGSRCGTARTYFNLVVVFLISGLWHGAGWTFLLWGAGHGFIMVVERIVGEKRLAKLPRLLRWVVTFFFINVLWVFFRAPSVAEALALLKTACTLPLYLPASWLGEGMLYTELEAVAFLLPAVRELWGTLVPLALLGIGLVCALLPTNCQRQLRDFRPTAWKTVITALLLTMALFSFTGVSTFIYSNF